MLAVSLCAFGSDPAPSDVAVEKDIKMRFARSKGSAKSFQVKVQGGIATIEGSTNVIQHKAGATRMAKSAGAKSVINNVKVSAAARQKAAQKLARVRRTVSRSDRTHSFPALRYPLTAALS